MVQNPRLPPFVCKRCRHDRDYGYHEAGNHRQPHCSKNAVLVIASKGMPGESLEAIV